MKLLSISVCCLFALAACAKQEPAQKPQNAVSQAQQTQPKAQALPSCDAQYTAKLQSCTPYTCKKNLHLQKNDVLTLVIKGIQANQKCMEKTLVNQVLVQQCSYAAQQLPDAVDYYKKWFELLDLLATSQDDVNKTVSFLKNLNTISPNPFKEYYKDGTCSAPYQPVTQEE